MAYGQYPRLHDLQPLDLSFSTMYSSALWRTDSDTIVFAKINKLPPPLSKRPLFEINKHPGGA